MKSVLSILLISLGFVVSGQRSYIYGVVKDSASKEEMIGVHVRNINAELLTSTNPKGAFKIPAQVGDTLVFSSVGYQMIAWVALEDWFDEKEIEFLIPVSTIYLEEVVVGKFPEYQRFKDKILELEAVDSSFHVYGVPRVALENNQNVNPSLSISGPFSALHNAFGKSAKEKRKMQKILQDKQTQDKAELKFSREWAEESTQLDGDKLTSFIAYCNFSDRYIAETPLYIIHEHMMALLPKFLEEYDDQS